LKQSSERTIQQNQLHKDLQYLLDLPLKLDIAINQRQYDRAVNSLLEPGKKTKKKRMLFYFSLFIFYLTIFCLFV